MPPQKNPKRTTNPPAKIATVADLLKAVIINQLWIENVENLIFEGSFTYQEKNTIHAAGDIIVAKLNIMLQTEQPKDRAELLEQLSSMGDFGSQLINMAAKASTLGLSKRKKYSEDLRSLQARYGLNV